MDQSRQEYRKQTLRLVGENEALQSAISKTERDTIEVRKIACPVSFFELVSLSGDSIPEEGRC